jgi:hypothetical protein
MRVQTKIYVKWKLGGSMKVNKLKHPEVGAQEDFIFQTHSRRIVKPFFPKGKSPIG